MPRGLVPAGYNCPVDCHVQDGLKKLVCTAPWEHYSEVSLNIKRDLPLWALGRAEQN